MLFTCFHCLYHLLPFIRDVVGEVHADSIIFSGALWKIRNMIPETRGLSVDDQTAFDQIILTSLALSRADETFERQFRTILQLLKADPKLSLLHDISNEIFSYRVFDCKRITNYSEGEDSRFVLPPAGTTAANISTTPAQLLITPRVSDWSIIITWNQFYNSPLIGSTTLGYAKYKLSAYIAPCPISFNGGPSTNETISVVSTCDGQSPTVLQAQTLEYDRGSAKGSLTLHVKNPGDIFYVW